MEWFVIGLFYSYKCIGTWVRREEAGELKMTQVGGARISVYPVVLGMVGQFGYNAVPLSQQMLTLSI